MFQSFHEEKAFYLSTHRFSDTYSALTTREFFDQIDDDIRPFMGS